LTSAVEEDNKAAADFVREKAGKVDVIIANAGESFRIGDYEHETDLI
jgi:NAD(P)-dependent dehydrogenase (short-subunit alcohol dehydrogenase family)